MSGSWQRTGKPKPSGPASLSDDERYECLRAVYLHAIGKEENQ